MSYISNPNSIILAVTPANQDFATSEPLKMARQVDPEGTVIKKYRITGISRCMCMHVRFPFRMPHSGRVDKIGPDGSRDGRDGRADWSRGSREIGDHRSGEPISGGHQYKQGKAEIGHHSVHGLLRGLQKIDDALKDEQAFMQRKYPTLASRNGTPYLSKTLNRVSLIADIPCGSSGGGDDVIVDLQLLMHHIRECLPQLKMRVSVLTAQCQAMLSSYGEPVLDKNQTLLQMITRFASAYCDTIDGTSRNIETSEL